MARGANGRFQKGPDPDRHKFTQEQCVKGGQKGFAALMDRRPEVLLWLKKKLRKQGRYKPSKGGTDHAT